MRRRDFITVLAGAAFAGPFAVSAQQTDRKRRVGVLMGYGEADPEAKALLAEFTQGLSAFGWIEGRNLSMDVRWAPGRTDLMQTFARELVDLQPDVILADSTPGDRCPQARDTDDPNCICGRRRPGRFRFRCEPTQPGWEHHWVQLTRSVNGEQVA